MGTNDPTSDESPPTSGEIQQDIEQTRADLGHTVDALRDKLDVKAHAQHKAQDVKDRAGTLAADAKARPAIPIGALVAVGAVIAAVWLWRRR